MSNDKAEALEFLERAVEGTVQFEDVGEKIAKAFEATVEQFFPDADSGEKIREIRDFADEKNIMISDALMVKAALEPTEMGQIVQDVLMKDAVSKYCLNPSVEIPEELTHTEYDGPDFEGRFDDPTYICVDLVREENPNSLCATAAMTIDVLAKESEKRSEYREIFDKAEEEYYETGQGKDEMDAAWNSYEKFCDVQDEQLRYVFVDSRIMLTEANERLSTERFSPQEQRIADAVVDAHVYRKDMSPDMKALYEKYVEAHPNSVLSRVDDMEVALGDAREDYHISPSQENYMKIVELYNEYNDAIERIRTIPEDTDISRYVDVKTDKEQQIDATQKDSVAEHPEIEKPHEDEKADFNNENADKADKIDKADNQKAERKRPDIRPDGRHTPEEIEKTPTLYAGHSGWHMNDDTRQAELAKDDVSQRPWYISEDSVGNRRTEEVAMPFSARADARVVMDYALAQEIWSHKEDYPVFGGGIEVGSSISAALDYIEKSAHDNWPMATELNDIVKEIDALGDRNGDKEHDDKIDELEKKQHDCYIRAGAIIAGANDNPDWRSQADAVLEYHRGEKITDDYSRDPRMWTSQELGECRMRMESFNDEGVDGSPARSGPAIEYCKHLDVRDDADRRLPDLWNKFYKIQDDPHCNLADLHRADDAVFDAQFASQNSQRMMDRIAAELEICKEGVEVYGIIRTPDDVEKGEVVDGGQDPVFLTKEEIEAEPPEPKSPYEEAKESYDAIKNKYNFRNTFTTLERLKFDVEAYKSGENGSRGEPVSGGTIAMDFIEFTRSNLLESMIEIALRSYFDKKYPAVEKPEPVDVAHDTKSDVYVYVEPHDSQVEFSLRYFDNGYVDLDHRDGHRPDTANPGFGRFMGANILRPSEIRDIDIEVHSCGPKTSSTISYKVENGNVETFNIPPIRLVEFKGEERFYLIDPFGNTIRSNIYTSTRNEEIAERVEHPYFRSLDISASERGSQAIEQYAESKGISVEAAKERITNDSMEVYTSRTLEHIEAHLPYVEEKLLPEAVEQLNAVSERLDYLKDVRDYVADHIENPKGYEDDVRKEAYDNFLGHVDNSVGKLEVLQKGLDDRVSKLTKTVELYRDAADNITVDIRENRHTDPRPRFGMAVAAEEYSYGKIDNPYYEISKMDLQSIDKLMDACDFKGDTVDTTLTHEFAGRDWPKESQVAMSHVDGSKISYYMDKDTESTSEASGVDWRESVKNFIPHAVERFPHLYQSDDVDRYERPDIQFDIKEALHDIGMLKTSREERIEIADNNRVAAESISDEEATRRLNMERHIEPVGGPSVDEGRLQSMHIIEDKKTIDIPSRDDIEASRKEIKDFGEISGVSTGFGLREKTPDLDWNTVNAKEILRDSDGKHFWMRVDGQGDDFIRVTPQQASGVLKGPLNEKDVTDAMEKYINYAARDNSTYSFATDFFDDNKYRLDPESVLSAFKDKLESYIFNSNANVGIEKRDVNLTAECLVSIKDTIVNHFADSVVDKMESIVEKCISQGTDLERVTAFVDAVEYSMRPLIDSIDAYGFSTDDYKSTVDLSDVLQRINDSSIGEGDANRLNSVIDALGRAFEGYPELIKDIAVTVKRDAVDRLERVDDAAVLSDDVLDRDSPDMYPEYADNSENDMSDDTTVEQFAADKNEEGVEKSEEKDEYISSEEKDKEVDDSIYDLVDVDMMGRDYIELDDGVIEKFTDASEAFGAALDTLLDVEVYDDGDGIERDWADMHDNSDIDADVDFARDDTLNENTASDMYNDDSKSDENISIADVDVKSDDTDDIDVGLDNGDVAIEDADIADDAQIPDIEDAELDIPEVDDNYNDDAADDGQSDVTYDDSFDNYGSVDTDENADDENDVQDIEQAFEIDDIGDDDDDYISGQVSVD